MDSKGQFITVFFTIFVIIAVLSVTTVEYNNLVASASTSAGLESYASQNAVIYVLSSQYYAFESLNPSAQTVSLLSTLLSAVSSSYIKNYDINLTNGLTISQGGESISPITTINVMIQNTQSISTVSPFQEKLVINSNKYGAYEAPNLANVQFTYLNGTIIPSWLEGGDIAAFNGNAYVNASTSATLKPASAVTWSAWLYPYSFPAYDKEMMFLSDAWLNETKGVLANFYGKDICSTLRFGPAPQASLCVNSTFFGVTAKKWFFYTATYSASSGILTLYINGNVAGTYSETPGTPIDYPATSSFLIGYLNSYFNGSIANVQVYNKSLSSVQVAQLYAQGMGSSPVRPAYTEGWWPLAGNTNDFSGKGNNGASVNVVFDGNGAGSNATVYWLRLGSIGAGSTTDINMKFYPERYVAMNPENTGEAPQLSKVYGQYDDGADVFDFYSNFTGNSLPSTFNNGGITYAVNNGITTSPSGGCYDQLVYSSQKFDENTTVDFYGSFSGALPAGGLLATCEDEGTGYMNDSSSSSTPGALFGTGANFYGLFTSKGGSGIALAYYSGVKNLYSIAATNGNILGYVNYKNIGNTTLSTSYFPLPIGFLQQKSGSLGGGSSDVNDFAYWIRIRAYPPNGVMPVCVSGCR